MYRHFVNNGYIGSTITVLFLVTGSSFVNKNFLNNFNTNVDVVTESIIKDSVNINTLLLWLLPMPLALYLPISYTEYLLKMLSLIVSILLLVTLLIPTELEKYLSFLSTQPISGYLWNDILILVTIFYIVQPYDDAIIMCFHLICTCYGKTTTTVNPFYFMTIAVLGVFIITPALTKHESNILTYETESFIAKIIIWSMYICWSRCYHLICRSILKTFKTNKIISLLWLFSGTLLVFVYGSSAFSLHFAYCSWFQLSSIT